MWYVHTVQIDWFFFSCTVNVVQLYSNDCARLHVNMVMLEYVYYPKVVRLCVIVFVIM